MPEEWKAQYNKIRPTLVFEGRYSDNVIISAKGDDYHFKRAGLQVSNKYLNQKDSIVECNGKLFAQPKCKFCGEKYGN